MFNDLKKIMEEKENNNYKFAQKYYESVNKMNLIIWNNYYNNLTECDEILKNHSDLFRKIDNKDFSICPTYPQYFIIPKNISDNELIQQTKFRLKGRVTGNLSVIYYNELALCWINNDTKRSLWRCAQPSTGLMNYNCEADQKILEQINYSSNENLVIFDARPYISALANKV